LVTDRRSPTRKTASRRQADPGRSNDSAAQTSSVRHVEIDESADGQRLDNFLMAQFRGVPRSMIYRIIRKGEVRVNKGRAKAVTRLSSGDIVRLPPVRTGPASEPARPSAAVLGALESPLFEDEHLLIVDKPSGLAVHSGTGIDSGLIEQLRVVRRDLGFAELAHRLDRATSGCLIIAKSRATLTSLHDSLRGDDVRVEKHYIALLRGHVNFETRDIDAIVDEREARSVFNVTRRIGSDETASSLVSIELLTGRNHQARIHATGIGHPVAGDDRHGDRDYNRALKRSGFVHPVKGTPVVVEAPLPRQLENVVTKIEEGM